nr:MAG TPA: hypothetical protein [Caudoviricetes sp.]
MTVVLCEISTAYRLSLTQSRRRLRGLRWHLDLREDKRCWIIRQGQNSRTRLREQRPDVKNTRNLAFMTKTGQTAQNLVWVVILDGIPARKGAVILLRLRL